MTKQLIMITAPFNCGYCETAKKDLPSICEENGFELIEMQNTREEDDFPVSTYPTVMVRVNEELKNTMNGYNFGSLKTQLEKY